MNKYPTAEENGDREQQVIRTILENNHYTAQAMYPKQKNEQTHKKHGNQCRQTSRNTKMTLEQLQNYLGTLT
jgi:hypothetical protein